MRFGRQLCGDLDAASTREWLVADGCGGYAMGTVGGLRTRRYHGLLVVATRPPGGRMLGLAALDPVLVLGDARVRLGVHEWAGGAVDPAGHLQLASFALEDGVPRWRWQVGDAIVERELAAVHGRPAVAVVHRLLGASRAVRLELAALGTWRDVHGERFDTGPPGVAVGADGFDFEGRYRVAGPGFTPAGAWHRGVRWREEAARGLAAREDLWHAGTFAAELEPGETSTVLAWAGGDAPVGDVVGAARARARRLAAGARDALDARLLVAADQFVVQGPAVVAGYPWFEDWSRDTMIAYEGVFLEAGRFEEGRALLERSAATLSEGMLANTGGAFNTADGTLWFLHAVARHVERTGDDDLAAVLAPRLRDVVRHHLAGTRFGIGADPADGLLVQGADGVSLTWMDACVDGEPVTQRAGKAVEICALWVNGLAAVAGLLERTGADASELRAHERRARAAFPAAFVRGGRCDDVAGDGTLRPNALLAVSLPYAPLGGARAGAPRAARAVGAADAPPAARAIVAGCAPLVTSLGLRTLDPADPRFRGRHRGDQAARDRAYHQGTVWPWLIGPYVDAALATGVPLDGVLDGVEAHLDEFGLGSVSETADGDPPHGATGCPFQAWSVAEVLRARRRLLSARP